jgi:hypothetical protein
MVDNYYDYKQSAKYHSDEDIQNAYIIYKHGQDLIVGYK